MQSLNKECMVDVILYINNTKNIIMNKINMVSIILNYKIYIIQCIFIIQPLCHLHNKHYQLLHCHDSQYKLVCLIYEVENKSTNQMNCEFTFKLFKINLFITHHSIIKISYNRIVNSRYLVFVHFKQVRVENI